MEDDDFALALADTTDRSEGTATVHVRIDADTLTAVRLDLIGRAPGGETGMRVRSVSEAGRAVSYRHADDLLRIRPPDLAAGQTRTFRIEYAGVPDDGLIIGTNQHGDRTFFGDNWPNRACHWLPVVDHLSDMATVQFRVTAPARYEVVSHGSLVRDWTSGGSTFPPRRPDGPLQA